MVKFSTGYKVDLIKDQVEKLDEQDGAESIAEYVLILTAIKMDLDLKIESATRQINCDGRFCVHKLCPAKEKKKKS